MYTNYIRNISCIFRNILSSNADKTVVPSVEELTSLSVIAEEYMCRNKKFVEVLGPIEQSVLWKTTFLEGSAHNIYLSPPVDNCLTCGSSLQAHHLPTSVICYTWSGPLPASNLHYDVIIVA